MYWINGIPQTKLSLTDRSIHFGDGFFTTARLLNGDVVLLSAHLNRLIKAGQQLLFAPLDTEILFRDIQIAAHGGGNGVIKMLISRGSGSRCYNFNEHSIPQRIVFRTPIPTHYSRWRQEGVRLSLSPIRLSCNQLLAGIKHNNRLEQVLIRAYLNYNNADEALVLDTEGKVVECGSANIFWRQGKEVFTPTLRYAGVDGVMRQHVISLLPGLGYSLKEVSVEASALILAEEVFITNSLLPIVPVKAIGDKNYSNRLLYMKLRSICKLDYY